MNKILIVDDERLIRQGLKSIIERKYGSHYEIHMCCDGKEALDFIKTTQVKFVITDIKMEDLNGIEFIKRLSFENIDIPVIILSGYDEFNYAVEALRFGAKDYLLKPVNKEELFESIEKIERSLADKIKIRDGFRNIQEDLSSHINLILLDKSIYPQTMKIKLQETILKVNENSYYTAILFSNDLLNIDNKSREKEYLSLLEHIFIDCEDYFYFIDNCNRLIILFNKKTIIDEIKDYFLNNKQTYSCGVSLISNGFENMRVSYEQSLQALKSKMFNDNWDKVYKYQEGAILNNNIENSLDMMLNTIGTGNKSKVNLLFNEVYNENNFIEYGIQVFETVDKSVISYIEKYNTKYLINNKEFNEKFIKVKEVLNFNIYHQYYHCIREIILYLDDFINKVKSVYSEKSFVDKAIEYINENYYKDLSLTVVSNVVSVSYSYFSQIFKENTGESFVNYIKKIRINKAKEILNGSDLKIYEVAKLVGYEDSKQFSKAFKAVTGIKPIEYKKNNFFDREIMK